MSTVEEDSKVLSLPSIDEQVDYIIQVIDESYEVDSHEPREFIRRVLPIISVPVDHSGMPNRKWAIDLFGYQTCPNCGERQNNRIVFK